MGMRMRMRTGRKTETKTRSEWGVKTELSVREGASHIHR